MQHVRVKPSDYSVRVLAREKVGCIGPNRMKAEFPPVLLAGLMSISVPSASIAQNGLDSDAEVMWNSSNSPYIIRSYDCANDHRKVLVVQGEVELRHPEDG